eukprot:1034407-Amphidinium_carterae.1
MGFGPTGLHTTSIRLRTINSVRAAITMAWLLPSHPISIASCTQANTRRSVCRPHSQDRANTPRP